MTTYQGQCHCGHHKWEFTLQPDQQAHILCHCDTCKVLGGGAFTMNQIVPRAALKITEGGEPAKYTYYGDSGNDSPFPSLIRPTRVGIASLTHPRRDETGKGVHCYYCPKCTTHIYHHQEVMGPDTIIARTGLLPEGRKRFGVGAEIYGKDKLGWEKEIAQTFDVLPPS